MLATPAPTPVALQNGFTGPDLYKHSSSGTGRSWLVLARMLYLLITGIFAWLVLLARSSAVKGR